MNKHIIKYTLAAALGLLLVISACTNLDEEVYDRIIAEEFTPTESDAFAMIGPAYTELRTLLFGWHGYFDCQEECSDIIATPRRPNGWDDGGVYKAMHLHIWNSEQSHTARLWNSCYAAIPLINQSLFQIDEGSLPLGDNKESIEAELRTLRAFYYYLLCENFGNVPITTQFDVPKDYLPDQHTRKEVYDFIINEINSNIDKLSDEVSTLYYGRMNKWVAHMILAKVYLNAEIYTSVVNQDLSITPGTPEWDKCIEQCDLIINGGKYALEANFRDVFKTENENSTEIIFSIPFDNAVDWEYGWFHLPWKTLHPANQATYNMELPPWGGSCAIPQFIDTYDPNDNRLKDTWIMGQQYSSSGDTLYCTMKNEYSSKPLEFTNFLYAISSRLTEEWEGYRIGKYEIAIGTRWMAIKNDFPFFRYADVLMMKAECLMRKGLPDEAAALVTQVRTRSFDNPADATVTGNQLLEGSKYNYGLVKKGILSEPEGGGADIQYGRFLDELGWEFAAESRRRSDLIRFGVFTTKNWLSHEPNGDFRIIFPIPQNQLDVNSKLVQNPGY
ncbi:MAG: RagB/SusD family nutrient uptake outer membrane protein [Bacteroidales bacterium]|nr:RagB/SusD family nutrient uptake outer membrane protein [Bacteroidales bacterium]